MWGWIIGVWLYLAGACLMGVDISAHNQRRGIDGWERQDPWIVALWPFGIMLILLFEFIVPSNPRDEC
jgi:hypothetical protein